MKKLRRRYDREFKISVIAELEGAGEIVLLAPAAVDTGQNLVVAEVDLLGRVAEAL